MEYENAGMVKQAPTRIANEQPKQPRERTATEIALQAFDSANQELDAVVSDLSERLQPVLHSARPEPSEVQKGRAGLDAKLPESIMSQVDCVHIRIGILRNIISRLAI